MKPLLLALICAAAVGVCIPARADIADSRQLCVGDEATALEGAIATAKNGLLTAMEAAEETTELGVARFTRWFGPPSSDTVASVRQMFERALAVVGAQVFWCPTASSPDLQLDANNPAAAYPKGAATEIFLGSRYFELPDTGENSKAGVLVHELTHLISVGPTGDRALTMREAEVLAEADPDEARATANNYEFFFEDALFGLTVVP